MDSDSGFIGIDDRCSACMSHGQANFVGYLQEFKRTIKDFGGQTYYNIFIGTIKWHWEDDQGKIHKFLTPKSYYIQEGGVIFLSPQHWAQPQNDFKPKPGTLGTTNHMLSMLQWKQGKYKRTIMLSKHNNITTFWLAPGLGISRHMRLLYTFNKQLTVSLL